MNAQLNSAIVRICKANGEVVGAGFLVSQKHVLTCAHVVNAALSRPLIAIEQPTSEVYLDFPLLAPGQLLKAQIVCWLPVASSTSTPELSDIAALELLDKLIDKAKPVQLVTAKDVWGHRFQVMGFPVGRNDGVWTSGELRQPISGGRIQIQILQNTDYRVESGFSGSPVWDEQLDGVVGMTVTAEKSRERPEVKAAFIIPTNQLVKAFPQVIPLCPYRGLFAFREEDARFFFGRDEFTTKLVASVEKQRLVAVIGASGSGKSSVVFAGLIPQLRAQQTWIIEYFRPGDRPLQNLAAKLVQLLYDDFSETDRLIEINKMATALRQSHLKLQDVAERILEKKLGIRLLLVADQFEELYTLCQDVEEQRCFIAQILTAVNYTPNFTLVLTLRADFLGQAITNRDFADALEGKFASTNSIVDHEVSRAISLLAPMNREEMRDAIVKPAFGLVELEEGLSDRILDAVDKQPGNLPLLEFALTQLWEKQKNWRLTHEAYDAIGGVEKALARYAQDKYNQLSDADKQRTKRVLIQLVRPGEGTEDTRRLATRAEVGEDNWNLVTRLADQRLVITGRNQTSGEETVEVIHEALIREWKQLCLWMQEERSFRTWQERLRDAKRQWDVTDKDEGALLRGVSLDVAEDWQRKRLEELSLEERVFIQLSLALRDNEKQERNRLRQRITLGLVCGLVITTSLALFTAQRWQLAEAKLKEIANQNNLDQVAEKIADISLVPGTQNYLIKRIFVTDDAVWMTLHDSQEEGKGLMRYDIKSGQQQTYLEGKSVTAILVEDKEIWVGMSENGVLRYLRHGSFQNDRGQFANEHIPAPEFVSSLVRDQQHRLWVGTYDGVCLQSSQQCQPMNQINSLCPPLTNVPEIQVRKMSLDRQRNLLWIATDWGLIRWHLEKPTQLSGCLLSNNDQPNQSNSISGSLESLTINKSGQIWIGTNKGDVKGFVKGIDTPTQTDDKWDSHHVTSEPINTIVDLNNGFFVTATETGGLFLYSLATNTWIQVSLNPKEIQNIYTIAIGADSHLWLGTNKGLYHSNLPMLITKNYE